MAKSLQAWMNQVYNKRIDLDNQSYDCVDVSKSWVEYLTDVSWTKSAGWGNAVDIYRNWSSTYLDKIPANQGPRVGDIFVSNGQMGGGYGHTGVVVAVNGNNFTIYQQDTFKQVPVYTGVFTVGASYIQGWLRPNGNAPFTVGNAAPTPLQGYQRVASYAAKYRDAPNSTATLLQTFVGGDTYDFKGFVHGESVDGNDIWFVGRYTGGYAWSGAFDDKSTHDLPDLTVQPTLQGFQRQVGNAVINYRTKPVPEPNNVIRTFNPGDVLDFDAWTHGTLVNGTDVWFRGKYTQGWAHASGFTDQTTHDLQEVKLDATVPVPVPPVYPVATSDPEVVKVYNKKNPVDKDYAPTDLVDAGNGTRLRKEAADSLKLMQTQTDALTPQSGYRSYATQETLYNAYVAKDGKDAADRYSARPGYSEHQTGLTMDFAPIDDTFANSAAYAWLTDNAYKYGWILRYTEPKESVTGYMSEPWHWRYVGVTVATDMRSKGIVTLEEYYNVEGGGYKDDKPTDPTEPTDPVEPTDPEKPYDVNFIVAFFNALVNFVKSFFSKKK